MLLDNRVNATKVGVGKAYNWYIREPSREAELELFFMGQVLVTEQQRNRSIVLVLKVAVSR